MFVGSLNSSRQTIGKSVSSAALDYINASTDDEEGLEKLRVHSSLLLSVLASICDLDVNHTALPWKIAAAIDSCQLPDLLKYMKEEWGICPGRGRYLASQRSALEIAQSYEMAGVSGYPYQGGVPLLH